jgi:thioredoxin 2
MSDKVKISCPSCGATNNYPLDAAGKTVRCGRCHSDLPVPGTVLELEPDRVYRLFQAASLPILVDFYSPTCAPCHLMHPFVEGLAQRRKGEIMVVKVNTDRHPELAARFGIQAVPTFVIISKGTERGRVSGAMAEADFSLWVASRT